MKTTILFATIVLLFVSCKKEETPESHAIYFDFNGDIGTNDNSTITSSDNNLVICGNEGSSILLLKISKSGSQIWHREINAGNNSTASGIAEVNTDLFICGSTTRNYSVSEGDALVVKTNSQGDTLWTKTYGGTESDYVRNIIPTSDGNLLISGKTCSFGAGTFGDLYLIKINPDGDTLWTRRYADSDQEIPFHVMETQNGEYLVTGTNEESSNQFRQLYYLKVGANGDELWRKKFDPAIGTWGFSTVELPNGDLLTSGTHAQNTISQLYLIKTDAQGNVIWEKEYGSENTNEYGYSLKQNTNGTFTVVGNRHNPTTMKQGIVVLTIDQNGNQLWYKDFGNVSYANGANLIKNSNGDNLITGSHNNTIFLTTLDSNGNYK